MDYPPSPLATSLADEYKAILEEESHYKQTAFYETYPGDDDATPEQVEQGKALNQWEAQNYEQKMEVELRLKLALGTAARDFESATSAQQRHSVSFPDKEMEEVEASELGTENSQRIAGHSSE